MPRYIDAEKLKDEIAVLFERNPNLIDEWLAYAVEDAIDEQPTADVVEVVRCEDCKYFEKSTPYSLCIQHDAEAVNEDGYCSMGEKRTDAITEHRHDR